MNHIFYIMGKSASGKDRISRELLRDFEGRLEKMVLYTTRPMREGEKDGRNIFLWMRRGSVGFGKKKKLLERELILRFTVCGDILLRMTGRLIWTGVLILRSARWNPISR